MVIYIIWRMLSVEDVLGYNDNARCVGVKKIIGDWLIMKKLFGKCVAACLTMNLAFGFGPMAVVFADDNPWEGFDASAPAPTYDYGTPSYDSAPSYDYGTPSYGEQSTPATPSYGGADFDDDAYDFTAKVDASSAGFIKVIRHKRHELSEFQDAVIEGLQVSTDKGSKPDEVAVSCYFIFRDKPTSYFYKVDRKERKLVFEFVDARIGSSPIAALDQAPIKEIIIEEDQSDANKDIKGLTPEWHDVIRITFELEHLPVVSVTNEHNIISFTYKWTTDSEKITQYLDTTKFPLVFWLSGGTLGGIGIGVLTYFLIPKKVPVVSNVLSIDDLPGGWTR